MIYKFLGALILGIVLCIVSTLPVVVDVQKRRDTIGGGPTALGLAGALGAVVGSLVIMISLSAIGISLVLGL